ncbi:MAG: Cell division coordinator CpoB [Desulfovibrio sp.]
MKFRTLIVPLLVMPLLVSCVKQGELDTLNARISRNEQQMQQLASQVGNVEQVLPGQAEMWAQMQAMRQELNQVRGQLDEMTVGGSAPNAQVNAQIARLDMAIRQMAAELGLKVEALDTPLDLPPASGGEAGTGTDPAISTNTGTSVSTATGTETPPAATSQDTATNLYDAGMNAFASRNYRDAVKAFTDFTKSFPQHKLTSNAHFWRGESYYQLKDYGGAALAYQEVLEKFQGSAKFQSAMLKQGMAFYYAGKKDAGILRLEDLIKRYPKSPEAGRAKKFLQQNK